MMKCNFMFAKKSGNKLKMNDNNVLVVEGIHALNPELTAHIPQEHTSTPPRRRISAVRFR